MTCGRRPLPVGLRLRPHHVRKHQLGGTLTRANPALWPEEPGSSLSWGEAAARRGEDGERRFSTEPTGAADLFTLQTKATTRDGSADPTLAETSHSCLEHI